MPKLAHPHRDCTPFPSFRTTAGVLGRSLSRLVHRSAPFTQRALATRVADASSSARARTQFLGAKPRLGPGRIARTVLALALLATSSAWATKVYINPSDQIHNSVSGGGIESDYALINANLMSQKLTAAGFITRVDQDFTNAPGNANSWGADIFVSVHSNAGNSPNQGHGTSALYVASDGKALSEHIVASMLTKIPYAKFSDGLFYRDDLYVLNATEMTASLAETVFHDCTTTSGKQGHPPSESVFLRSAQGQEAISSGLAAGVCSYYGKTCASQAPAKGFIKGVVYKDPNLDDHIAGATVKLNTGAQALYDGASVWSFEIDAGSYAVTASATGYAEATKAGVVVRAGEVSWASVGLVAPREIDGSIQGVVYKAPNLSDRIAGATVRLNTGMTTVYDGTNDWSFRTAPGTYSISVSANGYEATARQDLVVASGKVLVIQVGLSLAGAALPATDGGAAPTADGAALPFGDDATLPSNDSSALPASDDATLPSRDSSALPASDDATLPSRDSSALAATDGAAAPARDGAMPARDGAAPARDGAAPARGGAALPATDGNPAPAMEEEDSSCGCRAAARDGRAGLKMMATLLAVAIAHVRSRGRLRRSRQTPG